MSLDILAYFSGASSVALQSIGAGLASAAAAAGAAAVVVPRIAERIMPTPKETHLADFLPFGELMADGRTIVCRDGSLSRIISIGGVDQSFLRDGEARALYNARKALIDSIGETGATLRIFTMREPVDVQVPLEHKNETARLIARRWNQNFGRTFVTRTVLMITVPGDGADTTRLDEVTTVVEATLAPYSPSVLTQNPKSSPGRDMTLGRLLGRLVSPLTGPAPNGFGAFLSESLAVDSVEFTSDGLMVFRNGDRAKYCAAMGIRRLGEEIAPSFTNEINAIPYEAIVLQVIEPQSKVKTLLRLKQQQRVMSMTSFSDDVAMQYQAAIEMVEGNDAYKAVLCHFSEVILVFGRSPEEVAEAEKKVRQVLINHGMSAIREKGVAQASYFMQFPGYPVMPRMYRLMSSAVALLVTFDRPPTGLPRSDWGPGPIAQFYTGSNTVYSHQMHISTEPRAVGHGLCIAPTGAGKTTLMCFLSAMASRHHNLRHFLFDRYQGTYIYTTAMQGRYLGLNAEPFTMSVKGGMNPFQCEPTEDNIDFLRAWMQAITGCNDHESIEQIANAIDIAFSTLSKEERSLANIYAGAFSKGTKIADELYKWVDPAQYGKMFSAERDAIELDGAPITTFDMTNIMNDDLLAGASVSYIMHKIRKALRSSDAPGFIFCDETEPLLRNKDFKMMYLVMLQEFRKIGGCVVSVFQRPEALKASGISELVRQQCGTYYLFPNPGANASDYDEFDLTDRELGFILGHTQPARRVDRGLLIKKPMIKESVIVDIDLSPLGPFLKVFSSSSKDVGLASELQRQFGTGWVHKYIDPEAP